MNHNDHNPAAHSICPACESIGFQKGSRNLAKRILKRFYSEMFGDLEIVSVPKEFLVKEAKK